MRDRPLLAAGILLACGILSLAPGTALAETQLPACSYGDVLTSFRSPADWQRTQVDSRLRLPSAYVPPDLVPASRAGLSGWGLVRSLVIADLRAMANAARAAGAPIAVESAYRSYGTQVATFNSWVRRLGYASALLGSARPGHSEHQLGTAIDFRSAGGGGPWNTTGYDWASSRAGAWMMANAWRYGFVLSYPKGATASSCYGYEPWHYRYLGRATAALVHDSGMTSRAYLWTQQGQVTSAGAGATGPSRTPAAGGAIAQGGVTAGVPGGEMPAGDDAVAPSGDQATASAATQRTGASSEEVAPPILALFAAATLLLTFPVRVRRRARRGPQPARAREPSEAL